MKSFFQFLTILKHLMNKNPNDTKILVKKVKKKNNEDLYKLSQEELIDEIVRLQRHNNHLQNIIYNKNDSSESVVVRPKRYLDFSTVSKRHVLLKFFYLGWDFDGFVVQENTTNTVENHLFEALQKSCLIENRENCNYNRCGRTDKGVSAFCQVVSLDLRSKLQNPTEDNVSEELPYCSMLNRLLPQHIKCYSWAHVKSDINARFDCTSRTYKYYFPKGALNIKVMETSPLRMPSAHRAAKCLVKTSQMTRLNSQKLVTNNSDNSRESLIKINRAMQEGIKYLIGMHDFRNLCKMDVRNGVTNYNRFIKYAEIKPSPYSSKFDSSYQMYYIEIQGYAFLYHQIRCIMTVLFLIGLEKESPEVIKNLLNVEENPCKPQYAPADYLPLNLFHAAYNLDVTKWNTHDETLRKILSFLQKQCTMSSIKSTMIRDMIEELKKMTQNLNDDENQVFSFLANNITRNYKPLMSRMKCDSLEIQIDRLVKKKKLEIAESSASQ